MKTKSRSMQFIIVLGLMAPVSLSSDCPGDAPSCDCGVSSCGDDGQWSSCPTAPNCGQNITHYCDGTSYQCNFLCVCGIIPGGPCDPCPGCPCGWNYTTGQCQVCGGCACSSLTVELLVARVRGANAGMVAMVHVSRARVANAVGIGTGAVGVATMEDIVLMTL